MKVVEDRKRVFLDEQRTRPYDARQALLGNVDIDLPYHTSQAYTDNQGMRAQARPLMKLRGPGNCVPRAILGTGLDSGVSYYAEIRVCTAVKNLFGTSIGAWPRCVLDSGFKPKYKRAGAPQAAQRRALCVSNHPGEGGPGGVYSRSELSTPCG